MISEETKQQIIKLRTQERPMSYFDISLELGMDRKKIAEFCREIGLNKNKSYGVREGRMRVPKKRKDGLRNI